MASEKVDMTPGLVRRWRSSERAKRLHAEGRFRRKTSPRGASPRQRTEHEVRREALVRVIRDPRSSRRQLVDAEKALQKLDAERRRDEPTESVAEHQERMAQRLAAMDPDARDEAIAMLRDREPEGWAGIAWEHRIVPGIVARTEQLTHAASNGA